MMALMIVLALSVLLSFSDPLNDANGDGSLRAPTAPVYRSAGALDITEFELLEGEDLGFVLSFSSLGNPHGLNNGFSLPIIELYIEDKNGGPGVPELLPGSSMNLPEGETWHYAFQLSGDAVRVYGAQADGSFEEISGRASPELSVEGSALRMQTSLELPETLNVYGVVGNYSAFSPTGWQSVSSQPSPWAYSSATQRRPVVDVLALTQESQAQAIQEGVLPAIQTSRITPPSYWVYVMLAGILLGIVGVAGRFINPQRARRPAVKKNPAYRPAEQSLGTDAPDINWDAPQLNQNISEVVATGTVRERPRSEAATPRPARSQPTASKPKSGRSKPITFTPESRGAEQADPSLQERGAAPPDTEPPFTDVIDLRNVGEAKPKITRVQPPKPVAKQPKRGDFKIDDFDLDEVIAQDEAASRQPVAKPQTPAPLGDSAEPKQPRTGQTMSLSGTNSSSSPKVKPNRRLPPTTPTPSTPKDSPKKPPEPRLDPQLDALKTDASKTDTRTSATQPESAKPSAPSVTAPATDLTSQARDTPKQPSPTSASRLTPPAKLTDQTAAKTAPAKPERPTKSASQPGLSQPNLGDAFPSDPASKPHQAERASTDDVETVLFLAKPVKPEKSGGASATQQEDKVTLSADELEIYSLKQALKKLKPKDDKGGDSDT